MNACIRSTELTAERYELEVMAYKHDYNELIEQEFKLLVPSNAINIIQRGGTIFKTRRCEGSHTKLGGITVVSNLHTYIFIYVTDATIGFYTSIETALEPINNSSK
jgi:6-phosphofructokinase 1